MRGLPRILTQFPKSVLEKKVLPALLEETKDHELLSLILQNIFKTVDLVPNGKRALENKVFPALRRVFLSGQINKGQAHDRDTSKEAGMVVVLENMPIINKHSYGREFKQG